MTIKPLPTRVERLLAELNASPRLQAHLAVVHETACMLVERISTAWPKLEYDRQAVFLGAATHDIGKVLHREELSQSGRQHEMAGRQLLLHHGWPEDIARFGETHASHHAYIDKIEDLLVAIADKSWKGKRDDALQQALANLIRQSSGEQFWEVWLRLENILTDIASTADERLVWQTNYPV